MTVRATTTSNPAIGVTWKVLSVVIFSVMLTMVKLVGERVPVGQMLFARNFFGLIPVLIVIVWTGHLHDALETKSVVGHVKRAAAGMFAMGLWFAALEHLSLPEATAIVYVAPLMMVMLAAFLLGETVRIYRWSAVGIGFLGVVVILVPQIRAGFDIANDTAALGAALALAAAVFMALASVFVRQLARTEATSTIVLYFLLAGTVMTLLTMPTWIMPTWYDLLGLVVIGVSGGVGQLLLTQAYQHAEASLIAPFEYTSMIWVVLFGYFIFDEVPSVYVLIGGTIVVASGIFVILRERRLGLQRDERKVGAPLRP
ncbi:DMT family transporter [Acuticoccus sp. I52.16.1]|uniref:DMT family transporter n=1 Tax=Acuticoccus sp. I52.16.1 TaxID=2928472 RepID=UPI001FD5E60B|nr:DMT family transporter [Acuticoccus sp. I52.16.1]UOM36208.1 DMT family transporter [Acuticoccus sp. I52.16.1]